MSVEIVAPALGESVSEAVIAKWHKKVGESVKLDELILELETEKVTLEVSAPAEGELEAIFKNEGDSVNVGDVLGRVKAGPVATAQPAAANVPATSTLAAQLLPLVSPAIMGEKKIDAADSSPPSVRKLIAENNLNPKDIPASGRDGRINKGDVLNALNSLGPVRAAGAALAEDKPVEKVRMSRLRKTIAQRLKDSQNSAAILTTFNEIDMLSVMELRKKYREEFEKKHGIKLGFMSFFVKAVVHALKEVPSVNAEIEGEDIIYKQYYDIGVAVGTEQGLVVPVVRSADKLGFSAIEKEIGLLATRARDGKLSMSDLTGGTFSITNGGVYGSLLSTPIINPPQTGILGLHNTQERPVAIAGRVEIRPMMYVALSYDHRIIDGKDAVTFLVKIKQAIENPERLLFDL